jgi:hypothetical protein
MVLKKMILYFCTEPIPIRVLRDKLFRVPDPVCPFNRKKYKDIVLSKKNTSFQYHQQNNVFV